MFYSLGYAGYEIKKGVRIFHDFNNTAMGWALPALIGGHFADESREHYVLWMEVL